MCFLKCYFISMKKLNLLVSIFCLIVFALTGVCAEPVKIIYVHGVNAYDAQEVYEEAAGLNNAFRGQHLGDDYYFSGEYEVVIWGDLFKKDVEYDIYESGLKSINTKYNNQKIKSTTDFDGKLLNPFLPLYAVKDSGSGGYAVYFRNLINDFLYQVFLLKDSPQKEDIVLNRIQKAVDNTDGKFVLMSHSYGAVVTLDFLESRIMNNPELSAKFAGMITSADVNTTFNAYKWSETFKDKDKKTFVDYIIENRKFWICYNHRNDIAATNLPEIILKYDAKGKGFIVNGTTRANYARRLNLFGFDNNMVSAHLWMVRHQKDFAKKVVALYDSVVK